MKDSYLIQRLEKPMLPMKLAGHEIKDNIFSFGGGLINGGLSAVAMDLLRPILSFDYMGAAEFEFGAVPEALGKMINSKNWSGTIMVDKDKPVYYICPQEYRDEAIKRIPLIYKRKISTKEWVGLDSYFEQLNNKERPPRAVGWLEINNGYMFFGDKEMYEKMLILFEL